MMYVCWKGKDDYLTGEKHKASNDDPTYIIMSWLVNSMEKEIVQTFVFYMTAKETMGCRKRNLLR